MISNIRDILENALASLDIKYDNQIHVERTKRVEFGHFSTNLPLVLTKLLRQPPLKIAEKLSEKIKLPDSIDKIEIKPPGFINFFLSPATLQNFIPEILERNEKYGSSDFGKKQQVLVEFVSANPTGPLTVGHGRQAVLGDTIARILEWNGYKVEREYYYNDAGRQMRILGESTFVRYRQLLGFDDELGEEHYQGEYIKDIASELVEKYGNKFQDDCDNEIFKNSAEAAVFKDIKATLKKLAIHFDCFYNEKSLYDSGKIESVLKDLKEKNATYEKDGAIWFKGSEFGANSDRVLWKSVADEATYRLPDIAYHITKYMRKYDLIIDVFGADHHGTYPDVIAGLKALGYDIEKIKVVIHQFVTLTQGGQKIKMSTRKATYVTLDELTNEIGKDVVRYFFIMRGANSHLNFDLELAKAEGDENPVFYLQYAHARICSILRKAENRNIEPDSQNLSLLTEPESLNLLNILSEFGEICQLAANSLEPQQIITYLQKMATAFHKLYTEHIVISEDIEITKARLQLIKATKIVLFNGLKLIGISAPERM